MPREFRAFPNNWSAGASAAAAGQAALQYYYPSTKRILEGIYDDFPVAKRPRRATAPTKKKMGYKRRFRKYKARSRKYKKKYKSYKRKSIKRGKTQRIAKVARIGLGLPLALRGVMKASLVAKDLDSPTSKKYFLMINCCDMNNDQRSASAAAVEGITHVVNAVTPTVTLLRTPHYFDHIGNLYKHYIITACSFVLTLLLVDTDVEGDIVIAVKLLKSHDDTDNTLRNTGSAEIIRSTPGMRFYNMKPSAAERGGGHQTVRITGYCNVIKNVTKRVYYTESGESKTGEKTFASTAAISQIESAICPRFMFWAWKKWDEAIMAANSLSMSLDVNYNYTAYDRFPAAVS